MAETLIWI